MATLLFQTMKQFYNVCRKTYFHTSDTLFYFSLFLIPICIDFNCKYGVMRIKYGIPRDSCKVDGCRTYSAGAASDRSLSHFAIA